ncbi:MAG: PAS domain S-box protein [Fibrobacter sp.]|nr:PAS domain S-box protein [Fibrobacter sp.]
MIKSEIYRNTFLESDTGICLFDETGELYDVNRTCYDIFGIAHTVTLVKLNVLEMSLLEQRYRDDLRNGNTVKISTTVDISKMRQCFNIDCSRQGTVQLTVTIKPVFSECQRCGYILQVSEQSESQSFYENVNLYKSIFDHHVAVKLIIDPQSGCIIDANEAAVKFYGWPRDLLCRMNVYDLNTLSPDEIRKELESAKECKKQYFEFKHRTADGSIRDVEVFSSRIETNGKVYLHSIVHDVTVRKQYEAMMKLNEARLESLLRISQYKAHNNNELLDSALNEAIMLTESKIGYIYYYNEVTKEFTLNTWSKNFMKECTIPELQAVCSLSEMGLWGEAVRQRKPVAINDFTAPDPLIPGLPHGCAPLNKFLTIPVFEGQQIVAVIGVANKKKDYNESDIRQLSIMMDVVWKMVEARSVIENKKLLGEMLDNVPGAVVIYQHKSGKILYFNNRATTLYGYTKKEMLNLTINDIIADSSIKNTSVLFDHVDDIGESVIETRHKRANGSIFPLEVFAKRVVFNENDAILSIAADITERKKLELEREKINNELNRMQRLNSLGILAGGIAHDFNNLFGGVFGYIDLARTKSTDSEITEYLTNAMNTIEHARSLTGQLLTFAKGGAPVKKPASLFPFVKEVVQYCLEDTGVECEYDVPLDLWIVEYDKHQIRQVIENIVINATQAMSSGGLIKIKAVNCTVGANWLGLTPGRYIKIDITDSGCGIQPELMQKIFDPFFTTKPSGHGLGLSTSFSIVTKHGGTIQVESVLNQGCTFSIYLPTVNNASSSPSQESLNEHGGGLIIIMDDEKIIRDTTCALLRTIGYTVESKERGEDVLEYYHELLQQNRIVTAMIFDLTIPNGLGGLATITQLRKVNKDVPVFVASGYAEDPVMANPREYGFTASICKPFRLDELKKMLDENIKPSEK